MDCVRATTQVVGIVRCARTTASFPRAARAYDVGPCVTTSFAKRGTRSVAPQAGSVDGPAVEVSGTAAAMATQAAAVTSSRAGVSPRCMIPFPRKAAEPVDSFTFFDRLQDVPEDCNGISVGPPGAASFRSAQELVCVWQVVQTRQRLHVRAPPWVIREQVGEERPTPLDVAGACGVEELGEMDVELRHPGVSNDRGAAINLAESLVALMELKEPAQLAEWVAVVVDLDVADRLPRLPVRRHHEDAGRLATPPVAACGLRRVERVDETACE